MRIPARVRLLWVILCLAMCHLCARPSWTQNEHRADKLLPALRSGDVMQRIKTIEASADSATASDEIIAALRDLYLTDPNDEIRRAARAALGRLNTKRENRVRLPVTPYVFDLAAPQRDVIKLQSGGFGRAREFDRDDYRPPEPPTARVAQLIEQLQQDPRSSIQASAQLAKLNTEAIGASSALIAVMMRRAEEWRDARVAASEALEKINPELQEPVWAILVERSREMSTVNPRLKAIAALGPKGYPAMPVVLAYWNAPGERGFRVDPYLLETMHVTALRDPKVTEEIVRVLKGEISVGDNTLRYAIDICDERELPPQQILNLLTPYVLKDQPPGYAADKLIEMVQEKQLPPEPVVKLLMQCIEQGTKQLHGYIEDLGHFGPAAEEALPLLRRLKFEHPEQRVRKAAEDAMSLIDR